MTREVWPRVNRANPCPICGKPDACKVAPDGGAVMCKRIEQGAFKSDKGWHYHRLGDAGNGNGNGKANGSGSGYVGAAHKLYPTAEEAIAAAGRAVRGGTLTRSWHYHGADEAVRLVVARFDTDDGGKQFRPVHPVKGGWKIGDPAGKLPLYRLPELGDGGRVFVVEGEKCADAATGIGLNATTSAHGSDGAEKTDWSPLAGRDVAILPDHDEPGEKFAKSVATILAKLEPPARVRVVRLPGLPVKGDVVEFVEARAGVEPRAIGSEVEALADAAAEVATDDLVGGPVLVCLADVEARKVSWLWPGRVPLGRITLLVGRPGEGKSFLTTDMAARVTTGTPWPDGSACPAGSVILVSAEDDAGDTIKPRLDAHLADCRKVHMLSAVRRIDPEGKPYEVLFSLADVAALEKALATHPDCRLIVVDPIGSFLGGGTDAHRDNEVRGVLAPVSRLAEKYGPAVLVVAHRRKNAGNIADDLALGSRAFTGIARAVWHLSRDPQEKRRRLLLPGKNNLAPEGDGLAFSIIGDPPAIAWEADPVTMTADDAVAAENDSDPDRPEERGEAVEWLEAELADFAEHPVDDIRRDAKAAGLAWRTVQRAASKLRVLRERSGFGGAFVWRLPRPAPEGGATNRATSGTYGERGTNGTNGTNGENQGKKGGTEGSTHVRDHTCQPSAPSRVRARGGGPAPAVTVPTLDGFDQGEPDAYPETEPVPDDYTPAHRDEEAI